MAVGIIINILMILQMCCHYLVQEHPDPNSDGLDTHMLAGLAAGNHPSHPTGMVSEYLLDWWKRSGPPTTMEILWKENQAQLPECLEFHRAIHRSNPVPQIGIAPTLG